MPEIADASGKLVQALKRNLLLARRGRGMVGALLQTMATRVSLFALNIGTGIITARTLGAEGRGMLSGLLTWPQFIAYLMTFGLLTSMLFNVKATPTEKGQFFAATAIFGFALGAIASVAGILLMPHLLPGYPTRDLRLAQALMSAAPVILLALVVQTAAEASDDFAGANGLRGISVFGTFASVAALALSGKLSPAAAAACYLFAQLPVAVWLFRRLRGSYKPTLRGFRTVLRRLIVYGLRCYPIELLTTATAYVGQVMVVMLLEPVAVGYFTVSVGIARMLEIFYATVSTVLLPATAAQPTSEVVEKTMRAARLNLFLMTLFALPVLLAIPTILPLVYGTDFAGAADIACILLLEGVVSGTVWVLMQAFVALQRPEIPTLVHAVTLILSATMLLAIVPAYGVVGAAATLLVISLAKLIVALGLYRLILAVPIRRLLHDSTDFLFFKELLQK